jgi:virginiamycin B lyase
LIGSAIRKRTLRAWGALLCALLLSACGGAQGTTSLVPSPGSGNAPGGGHKKATVRVHVHIPARTRTRHARLRRAHFISASTNALQVKVYAPNSSHAGAPIATSVTDLSATSPSCTVNTDSSRTCTFAVPAPPPADDFVFTTWDEKPVSGAIPPAAKQLAAASVIDRTIAIGTANVINVTLGGIVASLQLSLPSAVGTSTPASNIHGVVASIQNFGVNALDADGNVIVSDGYVDATGTAQSIAVAVTESPATCGSGTLQLGSGAAGATVSLSAPATSGVQFNYGATALAQLFTAAAPCTFTISAIAGSASANGSFVLLGPEFTEFTTPTANAGPGAITLGSDGALWFTECNVSQIGRIPANATPGSPGITEYPTLTSAALPQGIAAGSDGALWFTENSVSQIGRIPTGATPGSSAQVTEFPTMTALSGPTAIANVGGTLWFTENLANQVATVSTLGAVTEYPLPAPTAASAPIGITAGPDGNAWFTESTKSAIGKITSIGTATDTPLLGSNDFPYGIAAGSDGALWFTEKNTGTVGRATTGGVVTNEYLVDSGGKLGTITGGADGALWVADAEISSMTIVGKIVRITTQGVSIEYAIPTSAVVPNGITLGPDGAIWFTESLGASKIGRLSW